MSENVLQMMSGPARPAFNVVPSRAPTAFGEVAMHALKTAVHHELIKRMDLDKLAAMQNDPGGRQKLLQTISQLVGEQNVPLSSVDRDSIAKEVMDEVFGLGPLEPLLHDQTVSDILVNTYNTVYVERRGVIQKTDVVFRDNAHLMHIIDKIVSAVGRRIDESSPMVDARLLDGSRVNIVIPPLAVDGPLLSIRRFGSSPLTADDLLRHRALTPQMLEILKAAVKARLNIVVSGGTGAGKTTLLNVLSGYISPDERIVTIEDSAELQIKQEHVARLECRPPNVEGKGAIRQRELVINALRMRPDRIILGEIRGREAYSFLRAINTGHPGSLSTIHADSPEGAIEQLALIVLQSGVSLRREDIIAYATQVIDIVIQLDRRGGLRAISQVMLTRGGGD